MSAVVFVFCVSLLLAGVAAADSLYVRQVGYYPFDFCGCGNDVAVKDGYAYVAAQNTARGSLYVLRVADPRHP
jgi:hypothetical protein